MNNYARTVLFALVLLTAGVSKLFSQEVQEHKTPLEITGRITSQNGQFLPGVSVVQEGTSNGAVTDTTGTYRIRVPEAGVTLVFTIVGYREKKVLKKKAGILDVTLEEQVNVNEEVVVVGYGTQKKASVVGAPQVA
ncbi:MAG: carboxypeptidase-like regulatory domain-containing protein [Niabella sp.]